MREPNQIPEGQVEPTIIIKMTGDGQIQSRSNVPSRAVFNMMMETTKQNMIAQFLAQEAQPKPKVQPAPPGLVVPRA